MHRPADYTWVDTNQAITELCQLFATKSWLTLDTEFIRETTYYAIPGLLQFSDGEQNWLIDPTPITDWKPLQELLQSELVWVMHACNEDLEVLHQLTNTTPKQLFDTQVAAHFVGLGQSLGYQKLINELCQIHLEKGESRTNWLKRPLTQNQLNYAVDDVFYLAKGWQKLQQLLIKKNLTDYFTEDMQTLSNWQAVDPDKIYQKVKFSWQLQQQSEINRLQVLAKWRELRAQTKDKPKRRILSDENLIEIAKQNPQSANDFIAMKLLNPRQISAIGSELLEVLDQAEHSLRDYPRVARSVEVPGSKQSLKKWKLCANQIAEKNALPATILFTNGLLEALFKFHFGLLEELPKMWTSWRKRLLLEALLKCLENEQME